MSKFAELMKKHQTPKREPLWKGPKSDDPMGGVTCSMIQRFLNCKERFRVAVVEGIRPHETFNHRIEYGNMWHLCEEYYLKGCSLDEISSHLEFYCAKVSSKHVTAQKQVNHWKTICLLQFPLYIQYWKRHEKSEHKKPIYQEKVFSLNYRLPSGQIVRLRGKMDSIDLYGKGGEAGIFLQENKTKGDINPIQIQRQLKFDLQTMLYLTVMSDLKKQDKSESYSLLQNQRAPIRGVVYNVIRRPLSGGKGSIVQRKGNSKTPAETDAQFYNRLSSVIKESEQDFFMRWKVEITLHDIENFKKRFLNPFLEYLCDWYEWVIRMRGHEFDQWQEGSSAGGGVHWQHPYGVTNILDEGGSTDYDNYVETGSMVGLNRVEKLFTELEE